MALKTIQKITNKQIAEKGVQALSDRPNVSARYGTGGLSAAQLKLWFDKLATFLAERINEIVDVFSSDEVANYIRVCLDEYDIDNFGDLVVAFTDGNFAERVLQVFPSAGSTEKQALQTIINNIAAQISGNIENIANLDRDKLDKVISTNTYKRAYIIMPDGTQAVALISESAIEGHIPAYTTGGRLNVSEPINDGQAANKKYTDDKAKTLGCTVDMQVDPNTYIVTLQLKNSVGAVLSTTTIDLPLESVVVGGSYDEGKKEVVLTLDNDNVIRFSVADIIDGLVSAAVYEQGISAVSEKVTQNTEELKSFKEQINEELELLASKEFVNEALETVKESGGNADTVDGMHASHFGNSISLLIDSSTYIMKAQLKNCDGVILSESTIDLPIESMVVDASYSDGKITLTLKNGNKIDNIDISDLVGGLASTEYVDNAIQSYKDEVNYKPISVSLSDNVADQEIGAEVTSVTLSWTIDNQDAETLTLKGPGITEPLDVKGIPSKTLTLTGLSITTDASWTLTATDKKGTERTSSTSINFYNGVYYGVADSTTYNSALISGLTKILQDGRNNTFGANAGKDKYVYYCVPSAYGTCSFKDLDSDFGFAMSKVSRIIFTNENDWPEEYDIYRSDNHSLGEVNIEVK